MNNTVSILHIIQYSYTTMISPEAEPPKAELPKAATCSRYAHSTKKVIFSTLRLVCSPVWGIFRRFGSCKSPEDWGDSPQVSMMMLLLLMLLLLMMMMPLLLGWFCSAGVPLSDSWVFCCHLNLEGVRPAKPDWQFLRESDGRAGWARPLRWSWVLTIFLV